MKDASATAERTYWPDTSQSGSPELAKRPRAKTIGSARSTARSNRTLRGMREDAAELLAAALDGVKEEVLAAAMNVTRANIARWLDPRWSDKRPAPLAMLLALDDADFDAVVSGLREMRGRR